MAEQRCAWYLDLRSGETKTLTLKPGRRAWVAHAALVDPASAAAGQSVRVAVRARSGDDQIRFVLSAERPVVPVRSTVMVDDQLWLERDDDDSADAVVRIVGGCYKVLATEERQIPEEGGQDQDAVLEDEMVLEEEEDDDGEAVGYEDDDNEEMVEETEYEWTDQEDDDYDSDEEEDDEESKVAGFMRVESDNQEGGSERQILVLYRYTRFSVAWSDGRVEARGSTREHQLRFIAAAGHGARSLAWSGASLAPLIYPNGLCKKLRGLWTGLASKVSLSPGDARVKVFLDVGILRPANCTQESMGHMVAALENMMAQPWSGRFTGMVLNLPEPMRCGHDEDKAHHGNDTDGEQKQAKRTNNTDGEQRPAKRRRVVAAGDDCSICFDQLEGEDIAAWPGCGKPHVFHGRCLELAIESNPFCPICRRGLYIEPKL